MQGVTEETIRDFFYNAASNYGFVCVKKELNVGGLRIDIFAVDGNHNPYIIEFKRKKDRHIVGQSAQYLAIVPSYQREISRKISFHAINWDSLNVILIAQDYFERDLTAAKYAPLKDRVHFYTCRAIETSRQKVFGLQLKYVGPAEIGPIKLEDNAIDTSNLIDLYRQFGNLDTRESRREYYTNAILPVFEGVRLAVEDFFTSYNLYFHTSYFGSNPPYYLIRVGPDKKKTHRASIALSFSADAILCGFDLTHSLDEAQLLAKLLQSPKINAEVVREIGTKEDYDVWIPNTGFLDPIAVASLTPDALSFLLKRYTPQIPKDCYFHVMRSYEKDVLGVSNAAEILMGEYREFKFMFDLLRNSL